MCIAQIISCVLEHTHDVGEYKLNKSSLMVEYKLNKSSLMVDSRTVFFSGCVHGGH